jgi:hypothetical protein
MNVLDVVVIPLVLAILALAWPEIQSRNRGRAFRNLIRRELEEISPHPESPECAGWWQNQQKEFVHQKIFKETSENRDFILSLEPDLVYLVTQLWDAKEKRDQGQWLHYLKELSNPKFDLNGRIGKAYDKWVGLCNLYDCQAAK